MTAPAFLQNVEQEELNDLATVLEGYPNAPPVPDADLDAVASIALREMARETAEIERYNAAMNAEINRIQLRYFSLIAPHDSRLKQAEEIAKECARRATFVGKAKSRKVGNGQYGRRTIPEGVSIMDDDKAINFLLEKRPSAVMHVSKYKIIGSEAKIAVLDHLKATGEVPDGFEHRSEHETFYAKPLAAEGND